MILFIHQENKLSKKYGVFHLFVIKAKLKRIRNHFLLSKFE